MAITKIKSLGITDGTIATSDIADDAITNAKVADNAVNTSQIVNDAVTTAKVNPAQTDITSVGTLTGLTVGNNATLSAANPQLFLAATADGGEGSINFKDDEGNIDGKIAYRTDYAGQTDNYLTFNTGGTEKVRIDTDANVSIRNANTTGPALSIGTTSTSVADGGFIGGIMFDAGTSNTACARLQALSNGTSEGGADFSFECRDSGASFTEKVRFTGDGNVGIGTTNPTSPLGANFRALDINSGVWGGTVNFSGNSGGYIGNRHSGNGGLGYYAASGQGHDFHVNGNTTSVLNINSNGYVTKPNHPCFSAYVGSGGHSFQVTDTTPTTIVFNTEHFDTTNSHSNGVFTAPVAGKYFFNSTISFYGTDTLRMHDFAWAWYKDNAAYTTQEIGNYIQESGASEFNTLSISIIISLNANQNVRTKMYSFGSPYLTGKINIPTSTRSNWHGFLIG